MDIYSPLFTDQYQLTMAYGYWKLGRAEQPAVFNLFYRKNPFRGNYAVAAGLANVIAYLSNYHFSDDDLNYLASLQSSPDTRLFPDDFLNYLRKLNFSCDLDAVPDDLKLNYFYLANQGRLFLQVVFLTPERCQ